MEVGDSESANFTLTFPTSSENEDDDEEDEQDDVEEIASYLVHEEEDHEHDYEEQNEITWPKDLPTFSVIEETVETSAERPPLIHLEEEKIFEAGPLPTGAERESDKECVNLESSNPATIVSSSHPPHIKTAIQDQISDEVLYVFKKPIQEQVFFILSVTSRSDI